MAERAAGGEPRLAYLVSRYPAISHTFILREVRQLRALGLEIAVASINDPDRPDAALTAEEREEAAATYFVKRAGLAGALRAHWPALAATPGRYLATLLHALRLGGLDLRLLALHVAYFVEAVMVARWMASRRLTHLHVHFATPAAMVGLLATRLLGGSFSLTLHGPDELSDVSAYRLREKIAACDFVCCIGYFARSQICLLSPATRWDRFEVAPLGVDPARFSPRPGRPEPDPFEVVCVGRLVPAKGQAVLLGAIADLREAGRRVRVRLVGDGPDRPALEARSRELGLGEAAVFEGAVDQDRIRELYERADAFALASFAEGIPVVLMEAMAMEIPCVTTAIAGIPELIRDGVDGLLVSPSDRAGLAAALARLIDDPELRRRIAAAGRRRVLERYDLGRNVDRLAAIYRRRLAAPGSRPSRSCPAADRPILR